jgi:hypothetical protein
VLLVYAFINRFLGIDLRPAKSPVIAIVIAIASRIANFAIFPMARTVIFFVFAVSGYGIFCFDARKRAGNQVVARIHAAITATCPHNHEHWSKNKL